MNEEICRKTCQEITIKNMYEEYQTKSLRKKRTLRNCSISMEPVVSKHVIGFEGDDESSLAERVTRKRRKVNDTVLDRIIDEMLNSASHKDVVLMITPSLRHLNQYKLHAIERKSRGHLGVTITRNELTKLRLSKAFQKYCIIISSRYIDLRTAGVESTIIGTLVQTLKGNFYDKMNRIKRMRFSSPVKLGRDVEEEQEQEDDWYNKSSSVEVLKQPNNIVQTDGEGAEEPIIGDKEVFSLVEEINSLPRPRPQDVERFFVIAVQLKFRIVIRPELCWRDPPIINNVPNNKMRSHLECFLPDDRYLVSVSLDNETLEKKLNTHKSLLTKIELIDDVFKLLPIPLFMSKIFRFICKFFGLELIYDVAGEYLYERYKNFRV